MPATVLGETTVKIKPLRRAAAVALFAGGAMLLAPAPAHAEFICWMSDGIRYCYDDGRVPGAPDPVPVPLEPPVTPDPVPYPVPVIQPPAQPVSVQPVPAPAPVQPAPAPPATLHLAPAPVYPVPGQAHAAPEYGGYQAADASAAAQTAAEMPAEAVPAETAPAEAPPSAAAAPVVDTAAVPTVSASPTAAPSAPSSASGTVIVASRRASSTETFNSLPLFLTLGGMLLAAALAWFVRPLRTALVRLIGEK
jgi:hypothetical protein